MKAPWLRPRNVLSYVNDQFGFNDAEIAAILTPIYRRADRLMLQFLYCHVVVALLLAHVYDTWALSIAISVLAVTMFGVSVRLLPGAFVTRSLAGVSLQIFVLLHIYQLHGMTEMHFFYFTALTMMLLYQDWLCLWPGALLLIAQHILFAVLHNSGTPLYFFEESYVALTRISLHIGVAAIHVSICAFWGLRLKRQTLQFARQEADLREAKEKTDEAAAAKSLFLAMMSHEIRTPMNAVMGMTQLLQDTPLTEEQREYAESARLGASGLLAVINDVLDFSRIEAGKVNVGARPFHLRDVLAEVIKLLLPEARKKGLTLRLEYEAGAPEYFRGDAYRIRQIALNLLNNAIKFTDRGSASLRVAIAMPEKEAAEVTISVVDTGIGISKDMLPHLFKEFSQLDQRSSRKYGGTGLGLAISRRLAELMGGAAGVESELGKGSMFWFRLPLPVVSAIDYARMSSTAAPLPTLTARVLVAEDNEVNRRVAVSFLKKLGCTVETAADGKSSVRMWQAQRYDVILMDCQMPEVDGYAATRLIRAKEGGGLRTPIIAMTANAMAGDREACLAAGMDDYIAKPLDLQQLAETLRRWTPEAQVPTPRAEAGAHDSGVAEEAGRDTVSAAAAAAPPLSLRE